MKGKFADEQIWPIEHKLNPHKPSNSAMQRYANIPSMFVDIILRHVDTHGAAHISRPIHAKVNQSGAEWLKHIISHHSNLLHVT